MSDCNCKCCHDHGAILRAHAGVEDVVRDTAEEAMRESGMMPPQPHSPEYMLKAFRQIGEKALYLQSFLLDINGLAARDVFARGLQFIAKRATEALEPVTFCDPPDNGIFTSPGEMAGNPSLNEQNEHATRMM